MLNIACSVWSKIRFNIFSKSITHIMVYIDQILPSAICNIESLSTCLMWRKAGFQIMNTGYIQAMHRIVSRTDSTALMRRSFLVAPIMPAPP